jgi:hypothetical protein
VFSMAPVYLDPWCGILLMAGDMFVGSPDLELGNGGSDLHINVKIGAQVDSWGRHWLVNISSGAC